LLNFKPSTVVARVLIADKLVAIKIPRIRCYDSKYV
jgi:hypothetical protein